MNLLSEFRAMVRQAERKQLKSIEDEALIAAGSAIEFWLESHTEEKKPHIFEVVALRL